MAGRGKKGCRSTKHSSKRSGPKRRGHGSRRRYRGGGALVLSPAGVNDATMQVPSNQSVAQGQDYLRIHAGQHGGGAVYAGAPVGYTGVLDSSLREAARINPLDQSLSQVQGMSDQSGGARRRKGKKGTRKGKKSGRKGRKGSRKQRRGTRRMRGGMPMVKPADYSSPGMLLSPSMESKALMTMNPEWKLAENPTAFAPK